MTQIDQAAIGRLKFCILKFVAKPPLRGYLIFEIIR